MHQGGRRTTQKVDVYQDSEGNRIVGGRANASRGLEAAGMSLAERTSAGSVKIDSLIGEMTESLLGRQADDGHWAFELEADATIPAEYILLNHFLDEVDDGLEAKLGRYLRKIQEDHGGWPLFFDGDFNISASVKAYFALKMIGDDADAPHMARARAAILAHGGAAKANVLTRFTLALFGQVPWRATPVMWLEMLLLPKWFIFHVDKVSYWSRTVMVPLMVMEALKPKARNPRGVGIEELFVTPPDEEKKYLVNPTDHWAGELMLFFDRIGRLVHPFVPKFLTNMAIKKAMTFVTERLNGEDGLGGIYPAIANSLMAFDALGYGKDHPDYVTARNALDGLIVTHGDWGYCQPCMSPVWDTGLASHALLEVGLDLDETSIADAAQWLVDRQILDVDGDWIADRPGLRSGGWAFQYRNDYYPDVDDTAVVVMALHRADPERYADAIERATEWIIGMQSRNGGWGAFNADNTHYVLQHIPFADHGALLDPPSADVSARCIGMLAQLGYDRTHQAVARGVEYIVRKQENDGSWFGRWGNNYVYGTWSVLCALNALGDDMDAPYVRKAVDWLKARQGDDGGWGEDCASYWQHRRDEVKISTPSQTSWAVLGLMAAGQVDCDEVHRGIAYLLDAPIEGGKWKEEYFNAVGFPRVFYLRYHGYSAYFPLWTLARYRNLAASNTKTTPYGM